jgi:acetate kinase
MPDCIGVLNSGSSSIKFSVFVIDGDDLRPVIRGQIESIFTAPHFVAKGEGTRIVAEKFWDPGVSLDHRQATEFLLEFLRKELKGMRLIGIGHRVAHGGRKYTQPVRLDSHVVDELEKLIPLVPLHQPYNLQPIRLGLERRPDLPQVGCFDTQFHSTCPEVSQIVALSGSLRDAGVWRYGFHGPSYEYIASALPRLDPRAADGRTVVLHLGNGASMCALKAGRSLATTMGFSSLDGLPMGTRCGALDPGVILFLMQSMGMDAQQIEKLLYKESGLLGLSGISSDMRVLLESSDPRAKLAVDVFVYRIGRELGSLAAALGGLDAIVFTAGIGENSAVIRRRVCLDAAWLGIELDDAANAAGGRRISAEGSRVSAWVIPTNEELMIARHTQRVLGACNGGSYNVDLDTAASTKG